MIYKDLRGFLIHSRCLTKSVSENFSGCECNSKALNLSCLSNEAQEMV